MQTTQKRSVPSIQYLRKRKFFMVLPLLTLPFVTPAFWALGGGSSTLNKQENKTPAGLNTELPAAELKEEKGLTKLAFYERAEKDSLQLKKMMRNDPYFSNDIEDTTVPVKTISQVIPKTSYDPTPYHLSEYRDANEEKVYRKLNELNRQLDNASTLEKGVKPNPTPASAQSPASISSGDIDRLENMMQVMKEEGGEEDPQMQQLQAMMDKILDIQHPERVKERIKEKSVVHKEQAFWVTLSTEDNNVSILEVNSDARGRYTQYSPVVSSRQREQHTNQFYSLEENLIEDDEKGNAIKATVYETQIIVSGATVKLQLESDIDVNGVFIPKGNLIYGKASLNGERLNITIPSIRYLNNILPVSLSLYDLDGMEGIYVPGAIGREVAKGSAENAAQSIGITSFNHSLGAQAATAGIDAAKTLLSKKVKQVKVTLKAGYRVLLKDNNNKQ